MSSLIDDQLKVDLSEYSSSISGGNRLARAVWGVVWILFFRPTHRICFCWRNFLLRLFGAKIGEGVHVYSSCKIWAPWNLVMDDYSCLSDSVDCYSVDKISIGAHATVSQYSFLCTATHDCSDPAMRLVTKPITISDQAWVCADVFVGPGVTIGQGAVLGARSSVFKDVPPWKVSAGNPAKVIKDRDMRNAERGTRSAEAPPE